MTFETRNILFIVLFLIKLSYTGLIQNSYLDSPFTGLLGLIRLFQLIL